MAHITISTSKGLAVKTVFGYFSEVRRAIKGATDVPASMPAVLAAFPLEPSHKFPRHQIMGFSEQPIGRDRTGSYGGSHVIVTVHNGGLNWNRRYALPRKMEGHFQPDWTTQGGLDKLLSDGLLPDNTPVEVYSYEDFLDAQATDFTKYRKPFAVVRTFEDTPTVGRHLQKEEDVKFLAERPALIVAAGGPEHAKNFMERLAKSGAYYFEVDGQKFTQRPYRRVPTFVFPHSIPTLDEPFHFPYSVGPSCGCTPNVLFLPEETYRGASTKPLVAKE